MCSLTLSSVSSSTTALLTQHLIDFPWVHATLGIEDLWGERSPLVIGEVILLGTVIYYFVSWWLVGRESHKAGGRSKQEPPTGYSPAALRYLWSIEDCPVGYDDGAFTASVIGLAAKGALAIEKNGTTFLLHDQGREGVELQADEEIVYHALFHKRSADPTTSHGTLTLGPSGRELYGEAFARASDALEKNLLTRFKRGEDYRKKNGWWIFIGVVSSLFGAGLIATDPSLLEGPIASNVAESVGDSLLGRGAFGALIALFFALVTFFLHGSVVMLRRRNMGPGFGFGFMGVVFGAGLAFLVRELYTDAGGLRVVAWMLFAYILNVRSANLLKRFSRVGRMVEDSIEGLQTYMGREPEQFSAQSYRPAQDLTHHDQLLPYAVALGRSSQWSKQFEEALEERKQDEAPSSGFRGDLATPEVGSVLAVNGAFHQALRATEAKLTGSSVSQRPATEGTQEGESLPGKSKSNLPGIIIIVLVVVVIMALGSWFSAHQLAKLEASNPPKKVDTKESFLVEWSKNITQAENRFARGELVASRRLIRSYLALGKENGLEEDRGMAELFFYRSYFLLGKIHDSLEDSYRSCSNFLKAKDSVSNPYRYDRNELASFIEKQLQSLKEQGMEDLIDESQKTLTPVTRKWVERIIEIAVDGKQTGTDVEGKPIVLTEPTEPYSGWVKFHYDSGPIKELIHFRQGERHGRSWSWKVDGAIASNATYHRGKKTGLNPSFGDDVRPHNIPMYRAGKVLSR